MRAPCKHIGEDQCRSKIWKRNLQKITLPKLLDTLWPCKHTPK